MSETGTSKESGAQANEDKEASQSKHEAPGAAAEAAPKAATEAAHEKPSLAQVKSAAKKEQIRKVAKAVRSQKVVLPKYQPKQLLMTDLLKQVNEKRASNVAHRTGSASKTRPASGTLERQSSQPDVVVVGSTPATITPATEATSTTTTVATTEAATAKEESKETQEDEEKRLLWEEKQREWEEEEREMERTVQRFTARVVAGAASTARAAAAAADDDGTDDESEHEASKRLGGWQQRFREQEERDELKHAKHKPASAASGVKRCHSASALVESDDLVGDGSYAAHDIDELLAEDTPEASEHFRRQCLRRKRMRDLESATTAALASSDSRSFSDEKSQQLLRRIQRTNVATASAAEPPLSSPSLLALSSQTGDSLGATPPSASLTHALQCLKNSTKAPDTARTAMFCALPEHAAPPAATSTAPARRTSTTPSSSSSSSSHKKR